MSQKVRIVDTDETNVTGEVTASPTSNTILARLKDLLTGVILAAGTNAIGKVGHDKTGIEHGVKVVGTAGVHVCLVTTSKPAKAILLQSQTDNTGLIAVGGDNVDATEATGDGIILYAGDTMASEIDDLIDVYVDATVSGEGVRFVYLT